MANSFTVEGVVELAKALHEFGEKGAKPALRKGVSAGGVKILAVTKAETPIREGFMRAGLIRKMERSRGGKKTLKAAVQITFNPAFNEHFKGMDGHAVHVKKTSTGAKTDYYYPASQEYGFKLRNGAGKAGKYFIRASRDKTSEDFKNAVGNALDAELTKQFRTY